ncbi:MAG: hypothetical protein EGP80_07085 [Blautia wexlerae]|nr:hypothetical protein [Blautia wexlerae]
MYLNPAHQSVKSCARYPWSIFQTCSGPLITKKVPDKVTGTFFAQLFRYMADILNMWQLYISVLNS